MQSPDLEEYMRTALREAEASLRQGNHGFGAVLVLRGRVIARAHDTEETQPDPTAHAELKAIRKAASRIGRDLSECLLVSTHEPCPMCAGAIVWSGLKRVAFGCSTSDTARQGRRRIEISCEEIFGRAHTAVEVRKGVLADQCAVLYDGQVRQEIRRLRKASDQALRRLNEERRARRVAWYLSEGRDMVLNARDPLEKGYLLLLAKLGISSADAPVISRDEKHLVFHSRNFCPTLEACRILRMDTRRVCRLSNEGATDALLRRMNPDLRFSRNYRRLRPHAEYCEEMIEYEKP